MKKKTRKYKNKFKKWNNYGFNLKGLCPNCQQESLFFFESFDAACCLNCNEWTEEICSDPNCSYCSKRPATPAEALFFEEKRNDLGKAWRRHNFQHKADGLKRKKKKRKIIEEIKKNFF